MISCYSFNAQGRQTYSIRGIATRLQQPNTNAATYRILRRDRAQPVLFESLRHWAAQGELCDSRQRGAGQQTPSAEDHDLDFRLGVEHLDGRGERSRGTYSAEWLDSISDRMVTVVVDLALDADGPLGPKRIKKVVSYLIYEKVNHSLRSYSQSRHLTRIGQNGRPFRFWRGGCHSCRSTCACHPQEIV